MPGACGGTKGWELKGERFVRECADCGRQTSVTAGTVMHRSHLPLKTWFHAAHLVATHSNGISALQLQAQLGIGSYKTAWLLLHKLRRAMDDPDRSLLQGIHVLLPEWISKMFYDGTKFGKGKTDFKNVLSRILLASVTTQVMPSSVVRLPSCCETARLPHSTHYRIAAKRLHWQLQLTRDINACGDLPIGQVRHTSPLALDER